MYVSGTGAGKENTSYRWTFLNDKYNPIKLLLTCPQKNDAFTVYDISKGNGALKYPIGLLTADEFWLAGGSDRDNFKFYLYTDWNEWSLSPYDFSGYEASERYMLYGGTLDHDYVNESDNGARAVLNLKSGLILQGTGTMEDPYRIAS